MSSTTRSWCLGAFLLVALAHGLSDPYSKYPCKDPLSSKGLSEAVDAAIVSLHGQSGWLHNLRQSTGYTHPLEVTSCTPKASMWTWPSEQDASGMLARVLTSGEIRVAGVKWSKGGAADYVTNPLAPSGFWPQYMEAVAGQIGSHYGKSIKVTRVYYPNSDLVNKAVANGTDVDMSEPYYYLGGFHDSKPRIEALHFSCVTVATASAFSSTVASGITAMDALYDKIVAGPNRKVGFIGAGNYDAVSHVLPANVEPIYITDAADMERQVNDGTLLASYISEATATTGSGRVVYETGVISPRVALFRQDTTSSCVDAAAVSAEDAESPSPDSKDTSNDSLLMVVVVTLAVVVLLMTIMMGVLICKERAGTPVFGKPLLDSTAPPDGQSIGNAF